MSRKPKLTREEILREITQLHRETGTIPKPNHIVKRKGGSAPRIEKFIKEYEEGIEAERGKVDQLDQQPESLIKQLEELEQQQEEERRDLLRQFLDHAAAESQRTEGALRAAAAREREALETERDEARAEVADLSAEVDDLRRDLEAARAEARGLEGRLRDAEVRAHARETALKEQVAELHDKVDRLQEERMRAATIEALMKEMRALQNRPRSDGAS